MIVVGIVFYSLLGWGILRGYRRLSRSAGAALGRALEGLKIHPGPGPGLVSVIFHTYYGLVAFQQTEHRFWAPPAVAREALRRMHRYNLRWGMFTYGVLLILLLSYGNLLAQRRSIDRQEDALRV